MSRRKVSFLAELDELIMEAVAECVAEDAKPNQGWYDPQILAKMHDGFDAAGASIDRLDLLLRDRIREMQDDVAMRRIPQLLGKSRSEMLLSFSEPLLPGLDLPVYFSIPAPVIDGKKKPGGAYWKEDRKTRYGELSRMIAHRRSIRDGMNVEINKLVRVERRLLACKAEPEDTIGRWL